MRMNIVAWAGLVVCSLGVSAADESPSQKLRQLTQDKPAFIREYDRIRLLPPIDPMPIGERVECFFIACRELLSLDNVEEFRREQRVLLQEVIERMAAVSGEDELKWSQLRFRVRYDWLVMLTILYEKDPATKERLQNDPNAPEAQELLREAQAAVLDDGCPENSRLFLAFPSGTIHTPETMAQVTEYLQQGQWSHNARIKLLEPIAKYLLYQGEQYCEGYALVATELAAQEKAGASDELQFKLLNLLAHAAGRQQSQASPQSISTFLEQFLENDYQRELIYARILQLSDITTAQRIATRLNQAEACASYDPERAYRILMELIIGEDLTYFFLPSGKILHHLNVFGYHQEYRQLCRTLLKKYSQNQEDGVYFTEIAKSYALILGQEKDQVELKQLLEQAQKFLLPEQLTESLNICRSAYESGVKNPALQPLDRNELEALRNFRRRHPEVFKVNLP